jgi:DNA-binding response OmpR family regulator
MEGNTVIKVMVIGNQLISETKIAVLKSRDMEFTQIAELPVARELIKQRKFDVVIVDSLIDELEDICNSICGLNSTPVVIMVRGGESVWKELDNVAADGFLANNASAIELRARIAAIARRAKLTLTLF